MSSAPETTEKIREYPPEKHLRVLGLPGSGKTRSLIERYKALRDDDDPDVFIITFSRDQLRRITETILDDGAAGEGLPPVLTYFTLAREIISASGRKPTRVIQDIEEQLLAQRLISDHHHEFKSDYKKIRNSERLQRDLLRVFHLFMQSGIDGEQLDRLEADARDDRLRDIVLLYRHYRDALTGNGYVTYYDIARVAAEAYPEISGSHPLKTSRVLLVDDFQDIDAGQFELLTSLAPPDGDTKLNVFGDPMGAYFGFRGTDSRYLLDVFPEMYSCKTLCIAGESVDDEALGGTLGALAAEVLGREAGKLSPTPLGDEAGKLAPAPPRQPGDFSVDPAVDRVEDHSGLGPPVDGQEKYGGGKVEMRVTRNEVEEIYYVAARVHDMITNRGLSPNEIAVLTNDKTRYEVVLRAAFAQRGIPINTGRPKDEVFRDFVYSLLTLIQSPTNTVASQALVTSPFYEYFQPQFEELRGSRAADPARKAKDFSRALAAVRLPAEPQAVMAHLVTEWLRPSCARYHQDTGDDAVFAFLSKLTDQWAEYMAATKATNHDPSIRGFIRASDLFRTGSASPMPSASEVGLYSCREVKGRFFHSVIVMGCSELLFPSPMRRETIIPTTALQDLLDSTLPNLHVRVYGARTPEEHLRDEYHLLYHSLTRARGTLCITAPKEFAGQSLPAPATILRENLPLEIHTETSGRETTPPQIRFARAWVNERRMPEIADRLADLSPFGRLWNLDRPEPGEFAIKKFPLSKSSLERYLKCPRQFFYERILGVKQEPTDPALVGTLFHVVIAQLARRFPSKRKLHDGADETTVEETIRDAIEDVPEKGEHPVEPGSLLDTSLRFHLARMIREALSVDASESDDYRVVGVEKKFPLTYGGWEFTTWIDRVEQTAKGSSILDFKTGKMPRTGKTVRKYVLEALENPDKADWQMPIYVWAYRDNTGEMPVAFRYLVKSADKEAIFVTIHICRDGEDVPEASKRVSHLLESEVKEIMDRAVEHTVEIFSERSRFETADDMSKCRCMFERICGRRAD